MHPQYATHVVLRRKSPQITCFLGPTFPQRDLESHAESYGQHVLVFFRPWRELTDLHAHPTESDVSWAIRLQQWFAQPIGGAGSCPGWVHRMLNNMQCLHEGEDKRKQLRDENKSSRLNVITSVSVEDANALGGFELPLHEDNCLPANKDQEVSFFYFIFFILFIF